MATADRFDTAAVRARVLDAWRASPARFREDANAEEDLSGGGYRDRALVELLQNAADAAAQAGGLAKVLVELSTEELVVANTGAPLTAEGVGSLASLRASAKRETSTIGRFGVGFTAVLELSEEPAVRSADGGVGFSASRTRQLVEAEPALVAELSRRSGQVPVLRLPFVDEGRAPTGFDTAVVLPLRDAGARAAALAMIGAIDDALLIALTALGDLTVVVDGHQVRATQIERHGQKVRIAEHNGSSQWRIFDASGELSDGQRAERPTEERDRSRWSLTWAVPIDGQGLPQPLAETVPAVVHAPTPSDDPVGLPAVLIGTFPLDPSRRAVAVGGLTSFLIGQAAVLYVRAVLAFADDVGPAALSLVPEPTVMGEIDAPLRDAIRDQLRRHRLLRAAESPHRALLRDDALVLDPAEPDVVAALSEVFVGLVAAEWSRSPATLSALEPRRLILVDAIDSLADAPRPAEWWRRFYESVQWVDRAQLDGLPVPLVDGRVVRDIRSCMLAVDDAAGLSALGLRVIHPAAAHPLLERLGARSGEPRAVLADPSLHGQLAEPRPFEEQRSFTEQVLRLASQAQLRFGEEPALGALPVLMSDGAWRPVAGALLPNSPLAALAAGDSETIDPTFADAAGHGCLRAVGALNSFEVVTHFDVLLDPEVVEALVPDGAAWVDHIADVIGEPGIAGAITAEINVVVGLDLVADDKWSNAWQLLGEPTIRRAIVEPVDIARGDGGHDRVTSFAAWWLSEAPLFDDQLAHQVRLSVDQRLSGLLPSVDVRTTPHDVDLLNAIGVHTTLERTLERPDGAAQVLDWLADDAASCDARQLQQIYRQIARLPADRFPDPPARLRVVDATTTRVVDADQVRVMTAPFHSAIFTGPTVCGDAALADLLDVPTTDEIAMNVDIAEGTTRQVPAEARALLRECPLTYVEHDDINFGGSDLTWWVSDNGDVHACTLDGLARGLSWAAQQWWLRWEVAAVLAEPDRLSEALTEQQFSGGSASTDLVDEW